MIQMKLAFGFEAICVFVNDVVSAVVLDALAKVYTALLFLDIV